MDDAGLQMVTCSNGGGPDFSSTFYDPAKVKKTVADHVAFVRDRWIPEVEAFLEIDYTPL